MAITWKTVSSAYDRLAVLFASPDKEFAMEPMTVLNTLLNLAVQVVSLLEGFTN